MRRLAIVLLASGAGAAALTAPGPTGLAASSRGAWAGAGLVPAGAGLSVRVARGWHLIHRHLTDVLDPAGRLALASFAVRLARHPCACGWSNVSNLPRAGGFVFVWEYLRPGGPGLNRIPPRPARFMISQGNPHWFECAGPSWGTALRASGRVFQVEVYLGPSAGPMVRAAVDAMLYSLRVERRARRVSG
jgi:hypothetical protein